MAGRAIETMIASNGIGELYRKYTSPTGAPVDGA
jgi:hypothetical protein